ncbi:unnamed protein product [Phaeothamnion confervicola]
MRPHCLGIVVLTALRSSAFAPAGWKLASNILSRIRTTPIRSRKRSFAGRLTPKAAADGGGDDAVGRIRMVTDNRFNDVTYATTVVTAAPPAAGSAPAWPPLLLVPPVGLGIDRSFYDRFLRAWVAAGVPGEVHAPDLLGTGSCAPLPTRRDAPLTPAAWAVQLTAYVRERCPGGTAVVLAQGGSCAVALEMAAAAAEAADGGDCGIKGIVLCGPPDLSRALPTPAAVARSYGALESIFGLGFYRFARSRLFLRKFSESVLFADDAQVDEAWVEGCHARGRDFQLRHAVFAVLSGAAQGDYRFRLPGISVPTLVLGGSDTAKAQGGGGGDGKGAKTAKAGKGAGKNALPKLLEYTALLEDSEATLLPGWNVVPYEAAEATVYTVASFIERRFAPSRPLRFSAPAMPRLPLIAGNWKLNPATAEEATALAAAVAAAVGGVSSGSGVNDDASTPEVVLFAPLPFVYPVRKALAAARSAVKVGAQNAYGATSGAFTGSASHAMVRSAGAEYVLVGHSERRALWREAEDAVGGKLRAALAAGLKAILCVGENREEFEVGLVKQVCELQLSKALAGVSADSVAESVSIAYEPVWAIGTGLTATPAIAQSVHLFIRGWLSRRYGSAVADRVRIQYGGSVTPETVDELMACPDVDGCLVGGASLDAAKFARIVAFVPEAPAVTATAVTSAAPAAAAMAAAAAAA